MGDSRHGDFDGYPFEIMDPQLNAALAKMLGDVEAWPPFATDTAVRREHNELADRLVIEALDAE